MAEAPRLYKTENGAQCWFGNTVGVTTPHQACCSPQESQPPWRAAERDDCKLLAEAGKVPGDYSPAPSTVQNTAIWLCTLHLPGKENTHGQETNQDP